jgi:phenylacetate-CoA ligase
MNAATRFPRFDAMRAVLVGRNRFYSDRLGSGVPLAGLPFTTKQELVDDQEQHPPFGTNLTYPAEKYVRIHQTSGTAGKPILWLDTKESWDWWLRCWEEVFKGAGVRVDDRVYVAFSFGPFIGFWAAFEAAQRMGAMVIPGGGQTTEQRARAIFDREATVLVCTPTYALRLADTARQQGMDMSAGPIRITVHAGEPGASIPETRRRIQEAFGAKTFDHVGMTEMGAYGFECEAQAGLHIIEDEFIAEIIDPKTLAPVEEGNKGEVVLTNLGRVGMPLIRYRTGDLGVISHKSCPCGRPWARLIGGVLGRADDMITIRGINVFPSAVENIVRRHPQIVEFAIEVHRRREMHELRLKIEVEGEADGVIERLGHDIHNDLRVRATIESVEIGSLPRFELKSRRLKILD